MTTYECVGCGAEIVSNQWEESCPMCQDDLLECFEVECGICGCPSTLAIGGPNVPCPECGQVLIPPSRRDAYCEDDGQPDEAKEWEDFGEVYSDEYCGGDF